MKKRLALLGLLALSLTACSGLNFNNNNNNNQDYSNNNQQSEVDPNDAALSFLNAATFFPEVGDAIDFNDYMFIDPGFGYTLSDYTFTSSDNSVIRVNGYSASCLKSGYAVISVTGPGINRTTEIFFWVGSFAGTYYPDNARLTNLVSITVGEADANRMSTIHFSVKEGTYRKSTLNPYEGDASALKNGTPFLQVDFADRGPKDFAPINSIIATLGVDLSSYGNLIPDNIYGLLSYDPVYGLSISTLFKGEVVEFLRG